LRDKVTYGYTYEQAVALVEQIRRAGQPEVWDGRAPYVGLAAFQEQDAALFFGRERLIAALVEQLRTSPSLAVFGPSGSGKSSVVRAGLIVALRRGALTGSDKWLVATMMPGNDPIGQLATALSAMALKAGLSPAIGDDLRASGSSDATALAHLAELLTQDAPDRRVVVFVDQFEESFTLTRSDERRQAFFDLLTTAAAEGSRVKVIVAARSDFLSQCAAYPELRRMINAQFRLIGAMAPEEMARAIVLPALEVGASVEPELVAAVVNETKGDPGMLPLLQFALKDLFDALAPKPGQQVTLTLDAYLGRGGMRQVLERRANEVFDALTPEQQGIARRVFAGLIEVGKGTVDTRRTARIAELVPEGASQAEVLGVVQALSAGRLLTTMADQEEPSAGARGTVTLVHERLIDAWPWLRKLVDENRQAIERQNEIGDDATAWDTNKRETSYLYAGARLQVVLDEVRDKHLVLSELSKAFLDAGVAEQARQDEEAQREQQEKLAAAERLAEEQRARADEQAKARQRLRKRALALVVALVLAVGAVVAAVVFASQARQSESTAQIERGRAESNAATAQAAQGIAVAEARRAKEQAAIANSRALAAQALSLRNEALDLSLLLGAEAVSATKSISRLPSYEARSVLLSTLQYSPRILQFSHAHAGSVDSVAFSPDGKTLASGSFDNTIVLWDVSQPAAPKPIGDPLKAQATSVLSVAFSPDGKTLASSSLDNTIVLWDVSQPAAPRPIGDPLKAHTDDVSSVAFSPDGKTLASGSLDANVILWDVSQPAAPKRIGDPLEGHTNSVYSVAFSPNGKTLASGSNDNTIILWDVSQPAAPRPIGDPLKAHANRVRSVAFSPDGKTLASGSWDKNIILWNVGDAHAPTPLSDPLSGHNSDVKSVTFSPDGRTFASSDDNTIILWDVSNPRAAKPIGEPLTTHANRVWSMAFSPDGKTLASGGANDTIILWDVSDVRAPNPLGSTVKSHADTVLSVAFSPDERTLASAVCVKIEQGICAQGQIILWDLRDIHSPKPLGEPLKTHIAPVWSVVFSPDGKTLASGSDDDTIILWDVSDPGAPEPLGDPLQAHYPDVNSVAFSPDGKTLASGGADNTILLWDVGDARAPKALGEPLRGHAGTVWSVTFSPDGHTLASGGWDGTIILYDVSGMRAPKPIGEPLKAHTSPVRVAYSPDGRTLASGSDDSTVVLWDVDPVSWTRRACHIAGRNMTRAEWPLYMGDQPYRKTCDEWPEDPPQAPATPQPSGRAPGAVAAAAVFVAMGLSASHRALRRTRSARARPPRNDREWPGHPGHTS
jgi:WD40 repeat protein